MGLFGGIKDAKYSEGGIYVLPGVYLFEIQALKAIRTRTQKDAFVAEFKVLESTNPERLPNSLCSWMVTFDKEPAMGNVKQFLASVLGVKDDQIDESVAEYAVNLVDDAATNRVANPCKGRKVRCSAVNITTKSNRPFTKCKFFTEADAAGAAKDQAAA
jgi:hypothetical protein